MEKELPSSALLVPLWPHIPLAKSRMGHRCGNKRSLAPGIEITCSSPRESCQKSYMQFYIDCYPSALLAQLYCNVTYIPPLLPQHPPERHLYLSLVTVPVRSGYSATLPQTRVQPPVAVRAAGLRTDEHFFVRHHRPYGRRTYYPLF